MRRPSQQMLSATLLSESPVLLVWRFLSELLRCYLDLAPGDISDTKMLSDTLSRGDKMKFKVVEYRTNETPHSQFAVIPDLYLSDLIEWLTLSEDAQIVSTTDNPNPSLDPLSDFHPPVNWPSYRKCSDHVRLSDLIDVAR